MNYGKINKLQSIYFFLEYFENIRNILGIFHQILLLINITFQTFNRILDSIIIIIFVYLNQKYPVTVKYNLTKT